MTTTRPFRKEAQVALMLLTRLPAGRIDGTAPSLTEARWAFPLVGLFLGLLTWGIYTFAISLGASPFLAAIVAIGGIALLTGALHFDGLADFADGIWGGRDKAHSLEIMRDSRIGSYGTLALILTTGAWVVALADVGADATAALFCAIAVLSRVSMVALLEIMPQARPDGMGAMAAGKDQLARRVALALLVAIFVILGPLGVVLIGTTVFATFLVARMAQTKLGGHTGDVLGTAQILSEVACWCVLSIWLSVGA